MIIPAVIISLGSSLGFSGGGGDSCAPVLPSSGWAFRGQPEDNFFPRTDCFACDHRHGGREGPCQKISTVFEVYGQMDPPGGGPDPYFPALGRFVQGGQPRHVGAIRIGAGGIFNQAVQAVVVAVVIV